MLPRGLDAGLRRFFRHVHPSRVPEWIDPGFARRTGIADRLQEAHVENRHDMARGEISSQLALAPYEQAVHWLDRVAAPFGIEVRHPFLDRRLAESVLATPPGELFELGCYKPLLRRAMTGILPDALRLRSTKTKLGSYVDLSLRERAVDLIEEIVNAPLIADVGYVDGEKLRAAFRAYRQDGPTPERRKIWYAVTLELWLRRHRDAPGAGVQPAQVQSAMVLGSC
jgi:asparagine synthase (glutamine-hydrolysing)